MHPVVRKGGVGQVHKIRHVVCLGASVAAFRENKHERMTYKVKKNKIHINTSCKGKGKGKKMMLREKLIEQCIQAMKRDDVKKELKQMFHPVIDMIMQEIYPYIYLSVVFVMISFLLTLSIFVLLLRTSYFRQLALGT
jgi:hypothetical protein